MRFARQVLDAVFASDHALDALFCFPGEDVDQDGEACRIVIASEDVPGDYGGFTSQPVDKRTVIEIRVYDEALGGGVPAAGSLFKVSGDAPVLAGMVFEVDREPMRQDQARLVWSCTAVEVVAE